MELQTKGDMMLGERGGRSHRCWKFNLLELNNKIINYLFEWKKYRQKNIRIDFLYFNKFKKK